MKRKFTASVLFVFVLLLLSACTMKSDKKLSDNEINSMKEEYAKYLEEAYPDESFTVEIWQEYGKRTGAAGLPDYEGYLIRQVITDSKGNRFKVFTSDEGSPAIEPIEKVRGRASQNNRKYYFIVKDGARVGAINIGCKTSDPEEACFHISPIFVLPKYQNQGIGYVAIQKAFLLYPDVKVWKLDTILQEPGNCHLYEKCGFVRVGEDHIINDNMTLIDYERR